MTIFNKKYLIFLFIVIIVFLGLFCHSITYPFLNAEFDTNKTKYREADYVKAYCKGQIEYRLPDKTRIDCLTDDYAIEFDWAKKWAESIGQSLYYAKMTGKQPAIALIVKNSNDMLFVERIKKVDKDIMVFVIKAQDYSDTPKKIKNIKAK